MPAKDLEEEEPFVLNEAARFALREPKILISLSVPTSPR